MDAGRTRVVSRLCIFQKQAHWPTSPLSASSCTTKTCMTRILPPIRKARRPPAPCTTPATWLPSHSDGTFNDLEKPRTGCAGMRLGRKYPAYRNKNTHWWSIMGEKLYKMMSRISPSETVSGIPGSATDQHPGKRWGRRARIRGRKRRWWRDRMWNTLAMMGTAETDGRAHTIRTSASGGA